MNVTFTSASSIESDQFPIEMVERKGLGHPDSICDSLSEVISLALSRYYVEHFGAILHHNVDKVLLRGGSSAPSFGGGKITAPMEICLAGRATDDVKGKSIPIKEIALSAAESWFKKSLPSLDLQNHLRLKCLIRPGSSDLTELYLRDGNHERLANDTSFGVGYAPLSPLEQMTLSVEGFLNSADVKKSHPYTGTDIKVMGVRTNRTHSLTVACAFVDRFVASLNDYVDAKRGLVELIRTHAQRETDVFPEVELNHADDIKRESIYLTVSGTSAEAGDDGETGRGNRINGLITPFRPMSLEAACGKNPVTHTGKIYQIAAFQIADRIVREIEAVKYAESYLLSQIGRPITDPHVNHISLFPGELHNDAGIVRKIERIVDECLAGLPTLWKSVLSGEVSGCKELIR